MSAVLSAAPSLPSGIPPVWAVAIALGAPIIVILITGAGLVLREWRRSKARDRLHAGMTRWKP